MLHFRKIAVFFIILLLGFGCKGGGGGASPQGVQGDGTPAPDGASESADTEDSVADSELQIIPTGGLDITKAEPSWPKGTLDLIAEDAQKGALTEEEALLQKLYFTYGNASLQSRYLEGADSSANQAVSCGNPVSAEAAAYVLQHPDRWSVFKDYLGLVQTPKVSRGTWFSPLIQSAKAVDPQPNIWKTLSFVDTCHGNANVQVRFTGDILGTFEGMLEEQGMNCVIPVRWSCPAIFEGGSVTFDIIYNKNGEVREQGNVSVKHEDLVQQLKAAEESGGISCSLLEATNHEGILRPMAPGEPYRVFLLDVMRNSYAVSLLDINDRGEIKVNDLNGRSAVFMAANGISHASANVFNNYKWNIALPVSQEAHLRGTFAHELYHAAEMGFAPEIGPKHILNESFAQLFEDKAFRDGDSEHGFSAYLIEKTKEPFLFSHDYFNKKVYSRMAYSRFLPFLWAELHGKKNKHWDYVHKLKAPNGDPYTAFQALCNEMGNGSCNDVWAEWGAGYLNPVNKDKDQGLSFLQDRDKNYPKKATIFDFNRYLPIPSLGPSADLEKTEGHDWIGPNGIDPMTTRYYLVKLDKWRNTREIQFKTDFITNANYASLSLLMIKHPDSDQALKEKGLGADYKVLQPLKHFKDREKVTVCFRTPEETPDSLVFIFGNTQMLPYDGTWNPSNNLGGEIYWKSSNTCGKPRARVGYRQAKFIEEKGGDRTYTYTLERTIEMNGEITLAAGGSLAPLLGGTSARVEDLLGGEAIYAMKDGGFVSKRLYEFEEETWMGSDNKIHRFGQETQLNKSWPIGSMDDAGQLLEDPMHSYTCQYRYSGVDPIELTGGHFWQLSLNGDGTYLFTNQFNNCGTDMRGWSDEDSVVATGGPEFSFSWVSCSGTYEDGATSIVSPAKPDCRGLPTVEGAEETMEWEFSFPEGLHYKDKQEAPVPPQPPQSPNVS